jgi:selenocysteine-specific elongation factor
VAACPGASETSTPIGVDTLIDTISKIIEKPQRSAEGPLLFEFDHCFPIKGQGTVLTGTILRGSIQLNQIIDLPAIKQQKKVKSMQMFHTPVNLAVQGDRVGICVTQLDAKLLERGIAADPGSVYTLEAAIVSVRRVRFFKGKIQNKAQFHGMDLFLRYFFGV